MRIIILLIENVGGNEKDGGTTSELDIERSLK